MGGKYIGKMLSKVVQMKYGYNILLQIPEWCNEMWAKKIATYILLMPI